KTQYPSVADMVRGLSNDKAFAEDVVKEIEARNILRQLMALRAAQGLSQEDIAEKIKCTQSRVSKLESANDIDLRIGDLQEYADALGYQVEITLDHKVTRPSSIRF